MFLVVSGEETLKDTQSKVVSLSKMFHVSCCMFHDITAAVFLLGQLLKDEEEDLRTFVGQIL